MKKGSGPHAAWQELKLEAKRRPRVTAVYLILRLIVLVTMVSAILRQEYESVFICLLVLVLFLLRFFTEKVPLRAAGHAGNHHSALYLCGRDSR